MNYFIIGLAFMVGVIVGGGICFYTTADTYEQALDESYQKELKARQTAAEYEELFEKMKPVHCPTPVITKIVNIDWEELDFPNSEVRHD